MKYLKISNKGEIDWRLISLLGGTTKRNDETKIGNFGSGLKYSLAYLLRENLEFKVYSGKKLLRIKTETEVIRDESFDIICIDGHRTSITTKMGPDFKAWQLIRELFANAIDEGEYEYKIVSTVGGKEGYTNWFIQISADIQDVINNWSKYFITDEVPMCDTGRYRIYPGNGSLKIYKNGILIHEEVGENCPKSLFRYDDRYADINELREYRGSISCPVAQALAEANNTVCKYFLENITDKHFEGSDRMDYDWWVSWRQSWKETLGDAKVITQKSIDSIKSRGIGIDERDYIVVPQSVYTQLTKQFEGVGALFTVQKGMEFMEHYDPIVENRVNQGFAILEAANYHIHPELSFKYGFFEDKQVSARVNLADKTVYISNKALSMPLYEIVGFLIEENEHFITGFQDCSRELQNHFLFMYTKLLLATTDIEV